MLSLQLLVFIIFHNIKLLKFKYIIEAQTTTNEHCYDWAVGGRKFSSLLQVSLIPYVASTILKVWSNSVTSYVTCCKMHQTLVTLQYFYCNIVLNFTEFGILSLCVLSK